MRFVHLNVHSNYSFCRGASRLEEIVVAARLRGMDAMALTDTNGLYGLIWFLDAAKAAGLRPIVGAEIDLRALARRADFEVEPAGDPWIVPGSEARPAGADIHGGEAAAPSAVSKCASRSGYRAIEARAPAPRDGAREGDRGREQRSGVRMWGRAVVLVKDAEGYAALCRLLSALHHGGDWPPPEDPDAEREAAGQQRVIERVAGHPLRDGRPAGGRADRTFGPRAAKRLRPCLTRAWLAEALADLRGCVVLSADAGLLTSIARLRREKAAGAERGAGPTADLYVELRPGAARGALLAFGWRSGIPPVATGGVHFVDRGAYPLHRLLRAIDLNTCLSRLPVDEIEPEDATLVAPADMARRHPDCPEALVNAAKIADLCRFTLPRGVPIFPAYEEISDARPRSCEVPQDRGLVRIKDVAGKGDQSDGSGEARTPQECTVDRESPDALLERDCLEGIRRRYGEVSEKAVARLAHELGIVRAKGFAPYFLVVRDIVARAPRTCGRGSAAASLISYALGITHVDPIRFDLFFERFLNPGRVDPPDIDVDFPWDERDDILDWVFRRYGRRRTAMIANHITFQARASVREIAKVYGLTDEEIGRVTKRMPWFTGDVVAATKSHPVFKGVDFPPPWPEILALARTIDGYPRGLSVHCGGVVVVPDAIDRYAPIQPSAKGVDVVQWEKDQSEEAGLVKIDLLGNRSLAVIRDTCRAVRENGGPDIRFETFRPMDDTPTQEAIRRGNTVGVFYVESPAMRQLQAKCDVGDFEHLVIHSSIIRPAANDYIREYVRRLRGGEWTPLHPLMADLLKETYGIMVYQEDVSKIAIAMAGFDAAEADGLRKILSKKHKEERLRDYRDRFFRGAMLRGTGEATVQSVWDMILSFAGYSFCKPHSASYALVSFKSAYLRVHHPGAFMAAVISNGGGYYTAFAYISESRRMGLDVLLPDVNESAREYTGRTFEKMRGEADAPCRGSWDPQRAGSRRVSPVDERSCANPRLASAESDDRGSRANSSEEATRSRLLVSAKCEERGSTKAPRGAVRVGFMQLKGFPDAAVDAILDERAGGGPFVSFDDFLARAGGKIGPAAIRILIRSGAFDSLLGPGAPDAAPASGRTARARAGRSQAAEGVPQEPLALAGEPCSQSRLALSSLAPSACDRPAHRGDLFWRLAVWERARGNADGNGERLLLPPSEPGPLPRSGPYDERMELEQEIESLGFLISRHPLSLFRRAIERARPVPARDLAKHVGKVIRTVGWYVTGKTVQTKNGEPMEFLSFEDTTALYETTFFPRTYARFCHMMTKVRPYLLTGRVEEDFGAVSLNVSDVRFLDARAPGREDDPVSAPHVGGTSPGSEAWTRSFGG